jgi:hypothetical protein
MRLLSGNPLFVLLLRRRGMEEAPAASKLKVVKFQLRPDPLAR